MLEPLRSDTEIDLLPCRFVNGYWCQDIPFALIWHHDQLVAMSAYGDETARCRVHIPLAGVAHNTLDFSKIKPA